ncbi:MAG: hypothetical protein GXY77_11570 [Fibrobacter sp.]|nr:hypothetical protein [Fibrobacter sp.]
MALVNCKKCLLLIIIAFALLGCNLGSQSEYIYYSGKITLIDTTIVPENIEIYSSNLNFELLDQDGNLKHPSSIPKHPDKSGNFQVVETTRSHGPAVTVEHWECGPLRLYIRHPKYKPYYDSLTNDQLQELRQNASGQWVLPDIILYPAL